ncbi:MAG: 16S rRNA (cytosine(967)-C(5))-methyltransferase RsmB [Thermodesulfobacteriota bacterium]|jgi:16S rRNA (cytosine967-C5)-methyltransferase
MKSPRQLAIDVLLATAQKGQPVDQVFDRQQAGQSSGDPRDAQLAMAMVYGVLRWQGYLDQVIAGFSSHSLAKMKPLTLAALRVGAYQLLFMDRVPPAAAINETVQALKAAGQPKWLTGFANGVLRAVVRGKEQVLPTTSREALFLSHPAWLIARWRQRYGDDAAEAICQANNEQPPLVLRMNTRRTTREAYLQGLIEVGIEAKAGRYAPDAIRLVGYRGSVVDLPGYGDGLFQVQDEAAQLATLLFGGLDAERYLDACAGLGGKTSHLARMLPPGGEVVAVEPHGGRRKLLRENLNRLGLDATIVAGELESFAQTRPSPFQGILIDAPCSGLGVVGRQPDIRWQRQETNLPRYAARQRKLLDQAAPLLAPRGVLLYATCSTEPEENEEVVSGFLANHPEFALADARPLLPEPARTLVDAQGCLHTLPHQGLDGFFAARLEKQ